MRSSTAPPGDLEAPDRTRDAKVEHVRAGERARGWRTALREEPGAHRNPVIVRSGDRTTSRRRGDSVFLSSAASISVHTEEWASTLPAVADEVSRHVLAFARGVEIPQGRWRSQRVGRSTCRTTPTAALPPFDSARSRDRAVAK